MLNLFRRRKEEESMKKDFALFAKDRGISSLKLDDYQKKGISPTPALASYISPTVLEERTLNAVAIDIFSRLMYDRIMFLGTSIDDDVANIVVSQLLYLDSLTTEDISLYINSPGGVVSAGYAIYDIMQSIKSDVSTSCLGQSASMAAVILAAGKHGKRYVIPHGKVMIHQPLGGTYGQASDIQIQANEIQKTKQELYKTLSIHTGKPIETIEADADRDFWMNAQESVDYGLVDSIVKPTKD